MVMPLQIASFLKGYRCCTVALVSRNAGIYQGKATPGDKEIWSKPDQVKGSFFYLYFNTATGEVELTKVMIELTYPSRLAQHIDHADFFRNNPFSHVSSLSGRLS